MSKNLILSSAKDLNADFDRTEKYIRLLDNFTITDSVLLKIFFNPSSFNNEIGSPIESKNTNISFSGITYNERKTVLELLQKLLPEIEIEDIIDSLDFLERNRLVMTHNGADSLETNGNIIHLLENKMTTKGIDFLRYVTNENS